MDTRTDWGYTRPTLGTGVIAGTRRNRFTPAGAGRRSTDPRPSGSN